MNTNSRWPYWPNPLHEAAESAIKSDVAGPEAQDALLRSVKALAQAAVGSKAPHHALTHILKLLEGVGS